MSGWLPIVLTAVLTALVCGLAVMLTRARGTPHLNLDLDVLPPIHEALSTLAGLTESAVYEGNKAQIFQNGAVFAAMFADIAGAKKSVHLETFVWCEGELEKRFSEALSERARSGIKVRMLRDAIGGSRSSTAAIKRMHDAGVHLSEYCRPSWWNLGRFNNRTHRKLLIIDGHIGYTFGHGVSDQWLGNGEDAEHWRDTAIRVEGPLVHALQTVFSQNWVEETHSLPVDIVCFPTLEPKGESPAHVVSSASGDAVSSVAMLYTVAIACARKEVIIQNPYFAPGEGVVDLFAMVIKRGVAVHLMVPGEHTDSPFVRAAGCHLYERMLEVGVRLYEFERTLCHQKIVVVDGAWAHIGSTNFDSRSLALNEEIGIGILDEAIARELKAAFEDDLKSSRELTLAQWRKRPLSRRLLERFAYKLHDQL